MKIPCSVEILTRNNAQTIERCLESVKDFEDIMILDGNSTDGTLEIARRYNARIIKQYETEEPNVQIKDWSEIRNKGLKLSKYDWFMYIDSDEYLSPEAVEEIRNIVESPNTLFYAWWQPRKYVLDGRIIDCASTYPNQQLRFFNKKWVKEFIKPVHERILLNPGVSAGWLKNYEYVPLGSLNDLEKRWRRYILEEAAMVKDKNYAKKLRLALRQLLLFFFYILRYIKNLSFCRGNRMPFLYEWKRHKYLLKLSLLLLNPRP